MQNVGAVVRPSQCCQDHRPQGWVGGSSCALGPGCRERQGWGFLSSATPQLLGELTPWCCHRGIPQPWSPSNRDRAVGCTWASCVPREGGSMHAWKGEHGVQAPSPAQLGNLTRRGWGKCGQVAGKPLGQCILPWAQTVRGREGSWGPGTLSGELPGVTQAPPNQQDPTVTMGHHSPAAGVGTGTTFGPRG